MARAPSLGETSPDTIFAACVRATAFNASEGIGGTLCRGSRVNGTPRRCTIPTETGAGSVQVLLVGEFLRQLDPLTLRSKAFVGAPVRAGVHGAAHLLERHRQVEVCIRIAIV